MLIRRFTATLPRLIRRVFFFFQSVSPRRLLRFIFSSAARHRRRAHHDIITSPLFLAQPLRRLAFDIRLRHAFTSR